MEEKEQLEKSSKPHHAFYIEAAIDERGPQTLKIVPSYSHQYLVYEDDVLLSCIKLDDDDNEWEQIDGSFTPGVVYVIGQEIMRVKKLNKL